MRTIYEAKEFIRKNVGKNVLIEILGIRNKVEYIEGIISECYANVFVVKSKRMNRSYSYSDVLIGNVLVHIK